MVNLFPDMEGLIPQVLLIVLVAAIVIGLSTVSDKLGIAPPLILMLVGVGISFLPFVNIPSIPPDWILVIILPPLLYAAAIAIPTVDFRRDFAAVGGLAVLLVICSAVILGFIIHWILPDVNMGYCIALGAILSPTDAAATTIIRRLGVPSRVRNILQGESLLNDATSLVLLRSAVAAASASAAALASPDGTITPIPWWSILLQFFWAALGAALIGGIIGWLGLRIRKLIPLAAPATASSFLIPFVAYIFAEEVCHASGLVAVVAAGLVAAHSGPKHLDARQRLSDSANWHTLEFLLEGTVFFIMGLELRALVNDVTSTQDTVWTAVGIAALALLLAIILRGGFIAALISRLSHSSKKKIKRSKAIKDAPQDVEWKKREEIMMERRAQLKSRLKNFDSKQERKSHRVEYVSTLIQRYLADAEYLMRQPLGFKEGGLLIWGGMRGVVTLAAAQTLPLDTPHRSMMILIAFFVAAGSLIIQGGTLGWFVKGVGLDGQDSEPAGEWDRLAGQLSQAGKNWSAPAGKTVPEEMIPLMKIRAQRKALLDLRTTGTYSSSVLRHALSELDAEELAIQIRLSKGE
jgi:CPA1 family monovalent cation:H+ antiporter